VDESGVGVGRTAVIGERELAIGFRLIGLQDVVEVTPATASAEFQKLLSRDDINLVVASEGVRRRLSENQRVQAEGSLAPLVVFVPSPTGEYEIESLAALAKRVLGVSLQV
jgi:V/A-type H+/Na+-transporting ATPase subunit F